MPGTSFSVDLLVVTPDQLRKIEINLTKTIKDDGSDQWSMLFDLQDRTVTTNPFVDVIKLTVSINPGQNDKANATAVNGLDNAQTSAAFTAADSAKLAFQKVISTATARSDAKKVISARGTS